MVWTRATSRGAGTERVLSAVPKCWRFWTESFRCFFVWPAQTKMKVRLRKWIARESLRSAWDFWYRNLFSRPCVALSASTCVVCSVPADSPKYKWGMTAWSYYDVLRTAMWISDAVTKKKIRIYIEPTVFRPRLGAKKLNRGFGGNEVQRAVWSWPHLQTLKQLLIACTEVIS